ncbi:MAG: hypothetical protein ACR5K7_03785 [Symbiopectobacterium sp.]
MSVIMSLNVSPNCVSLSILKELTLSTVLPTRILGWHGSRSCTHNKTINLNKTML